MLILEPAAFFKGFYGVGPLANSRIPDLWGGMVSVLERARGGNFLASVICDGLFGSSPPWC